MQELFTIYLKKIIYRAFDRELEREVVLKEHFPSGLCHREPGTAEVVPTDAAAYELSLSSFCRGARIPAALQHENLPEYHPIQLVHYDNQSKLIRYSEKAVLPPREEAFVKALLDLQEQYERETNVIYQEYTSIENRGKAHSGAYYRNIYNAQKKLNDSVVALIDDFINKHYGGNDPYALWTAMLKEGVRETRLKQYEFFINHHATHPRHLIAYDENGSLVEPKKMNFVQSETDFVYTLLKYQQEFDRSLKKAQDDAAAANSPLSQQQLDSLTQELRLELNKKVLKKPDEYLYHSIDEEHPEYRYNQELRDNVLKHNIKQ